MNHLFQNYQGKPWNNHAQEIPIKLHCEWYDMGGEGVAYHDKDSINNGSEKLNPANGNYSIRVNKTGYYSIDLMYTASGDGGIALLMDGKVISSEIVVASTRNEKETVAWRQWHHWNKMSAKIPTKLIKGKHILTLKTVTNGNMSYDFIDFGWLHK